MRKTYFKGIIFLCIFLPFLYGCSKRSKPTNDAAQVGRTNILLKQNNDPVLFSDDFNDATFTDVWPSFGVQGNYTAVQTGGQLVFSGFGTPLLDTPAAGEKLGFIAIDRISCADLSQTVSVEAQVDVSQSVLGGTAHIALQLELVGTPHPNTLGNAVLLGIGRRNFPDPDHPIICNPTTQAEVIVSHVTKVFEILTCVPLTGLHHLKLNVLPAAVTCPDSPTHVCSSGTVEVNGQPFVFTNAARITAVASPQVVGGVIRMPCTSFVCGPTENISDPSVFLHSLVDNFVLTGSMAPGCECPGPPTSLAQLIGQLAQVEQDFKNATFPTSDSLAAKVGATKDALQRAKDALVFKENCKLAENMINAAINDLIALRNEIEAQSGKKIPVSDAQDFISGINEVIGLLEALIPNLCVPLGC